MTQDFCSALLELTGCETSCLFDKMFEILLKESADTVEFLKMYKLASDQMKPSEILQLVKSFSGTIVVPKKISDMWNWSPVKALAYIKKEFETIGYPLSTLKMYIKNNSHEIYMAGKSDNKSEICFATLLNKSGSQIILEKCEPTKDELYDALKNSDVENWSDIILEKFLDVRKEQGIDEDEFIEAMRFVNTLTYSWKQLSMISTIPDCSNVSNASNVSNLALAEIYAGNYDIIPQSEPESLTIVDELITDKAAFDQLDNSSKLRASHFLCSNFGRFNNLLIKFVQRIFDTFNLVSKTNFNKELSAVNCEGSIYNKNEIVNKVFQEIQDSMSNFAVKDLNTGMNAILYGYIPVLMKYKKSNYYDARLVNNMMYYNTLKIIGVVGKLFEPVRSYIDISKCKPVQSAQPVQLVQPAQPASVLQGGKVDKFKGGYEKFSTKEEEYKIYKPNSSTGKYLKQLRELQIEYNNKFVQIYREIISKLEEIKQEEITSLDNVRAATIIGQFEKILISSNRTTVYLSGILPTKNYSKQFIDAASNLGKLCKTIGGCFEKFDEIVGRFVKLGKETTMKYQKIRSEYLDSAKDASEMLINSENIDAFKVKCDLKKDDFIRKIDACQRIFAMCNNRAGVKVGSSTAEMLKKYISGMTDRDKMITEYFDSYESGIKYILSQTHRSDDLTLIKPLISMKMILVDETKKAYLWLNQYLDKFLIDKRLEQLGKASLDKKTVEKIANAFVEFKKYSKIGLDELIRKYRSFLSTENPSNISVNSYFKLFKLAKQTFEEVDAFTYLEKLYNELGITDNSFNWPTFKSKLIGYLINGMIWFDIYEYKEDSTEFNLMPNINGERGSHLIQHINPANIYSVEDSTIPEEIRDYAINKLRLEDEDIKYRMKRVAEILNMGCDIYTKQIAGYKENDDSWTRNGNKYLIPTDILEEIRQAIFNVDKLDKLSVDDHDKAIKILTDAKKRFGIKDLSENNFIQKCGQNTQLSIELTKYITKEWKDYVGDKTFKGITRIAKQNNRINETDEYGIDDDYDDNFTNQNKYLYHYTNFGYALKKICMTNGLFKISGAIIGFSMRQMGKVVSLFNGFEQYVIESMYTPVLQIVDKYIIQRYQGSRDYSMNTNDLLQGGEDSKDNMKREAGSVFDIVEPHEPIESGIISQAVPFYISAYVILNYYARHYSNVDEDMQLKLSISSISPLSDFKDKFTNDNKFKISDEQELKQYVSIMNEYWNSTTAQTDKEKVINAIEHIISELNSMLIFGNDEKVIRLQESGIDESNLDIYTINFAKIHDTLVNTITEATNNIVRKGVNNNATVETYFNKKIQEVKEATPSQRIGILKQILYDVYDDTKQDANNEYASFIDLCVSPMFIINEIYKNVVDMTKYTFKQNFYVDDSEEIAAAQLNQTNDFNKLALVYYEKGYKTVGDIVKHLFDEYYRDFDQTLHNIMNFPGLSDGQIKAFLDNVHETFKTLTEQTRANIKNSESFKLVDQVEYIKNKILIPDTEIQSKLLQDIYMDETIFSPDTVMFANKETKSFTQFVINVIASLNPSCFVPQIFSDLIKSSSLVNNTFEVMAKPKYTKKDASFNPYEGKCLSTYIMCMSTTQTAVNSMGSNQMTQTIANKYVSTIPMLIAILTKCSSVLDTNASYKVLIDKKENYTNYQNINARTEIGILIDILAKTYNDILPFSGEIQFMNGSTTTFSHYLSEIRYQLTTSGLNFKTFIQQPEKYEWIFERACPELKIRYKSYDRFRDYRTKFAIILSDITFNKQFDVLLNVLAKNIFRTFFTSVTYDPEISGNAFNDAAFSGRMVGGDEIMNINTILNALGLSNLNDSENSVIAKLFEVANVDHVSLETQTIQNLINGTEFIGMLHRIKDKIRIRTTTDSAYAMFVNNELEGDYPKKDTVSVPYGVIDASQYINQNHNLIKLTTDIPFVKFYIIQDQNELNDESIKQFKNAKYTTEDTVKLLTYIKYNTSYDQNDHICSNVLNTYIKNAAECYLEYLSNNEPDRKLKFENGEPKPILIPLFFDDVIKQTYPQLNDLIASVGNDIFCLHNPFEQTAEWCRVSSAYKDAYSKFKYRAIISAWELFITANKFNFSIESSDIKVFDLMIRKQIDVCKDLTDEEYATPCPIIYDSKCEGYEIHKYITFATLFDLISNVGVGLEVNGQNPDYRPYPQYGNYPPCEGFWNLFAVPDVKDDSYKIVEMKFNFIISSEDNVDFKIKSYDIENYAKVLSGMVPDGEDYSDMIRKMNLNNEYINTLFNSTFGISTNEKYKFIKNDSVDSEMITKVSLDWLTSKIKRRVRILDLMNNIVRDKNMKSDEQDKLIQRLNPFLSPNIDDNLKHEFANRSEVYDLNTLPDIMYCTDENENIMYLYVNDKNVSVVPLPYGYVYGNIQNVADIYDKIAEDSKLLNDLIFALNHPADADHDVKDEDKIDFNPEPFIIQDIKEKYNQGANGNELSQVQFYDWNNGQYVKNQAPIGNETAKKIIDVLDNNGLSLVMYPYKNADDGNDKIPPKYIGKVDKKTAEGLVDRSEDFKYSERFIDFYDGVVGTYQQQNPPVADLAEIRKHIMVVSYRRDPQKYIEVLTDFILGLYYDKNTVSEKNDKYQVIYDWLKVMNPFIADITKTFRDMFKVVYNLYDSNELIKSIVSTGTDSTEIINDLAALKKTFMDSKYKNGTLEKGYILFGLLSNIYIKYIQNIEPINNNNASILATIVKNQIADILYNFMLNYKNGYTISPSVELSDNFMIQPLTCNGLIMESFGMFTDVLNNQGQQKIIVNNKTDNLIEGDGEIALAIDKTLRDMEDNFANLNLDSLMVKNMRGGDLEDVDSSVLLNMYAKADNKFKKFLSTSDTKLETMIIAYFNKPLLSFNTYFNKNVFVEIIYNSALFKTSLLKIHNNLKGEQNKYWARLINSIFSANALPNPNDKEGIWNNRKDIKNAEIDDDSTIYGAITQPTTHRRFFDYKQERIGFDEDMYNYLNRIQGDGLTKLLLKIDACNEAVGTLAQWIKNFTFTNVEYNDEETFTKYDYEHEPFTY